MRALLFLLSAIIATAQTRPPVMEDVGKTNLPAQKLGVDDLVAVSVYDAPELTRTVRVEPDGMVHLPLLDDGIAAIGLMPRQLESAIASALKIGEIMVNPIVKVTVVEYHSRPIAVMGAVRKPLTFQAEGTVTLLDALARAEGLSTDSGTEVLVTRAGQILRIPIKALLHDAEPSANVLLTGGEEIRVPEAGKITVVGNVIRPGAFPVREAGDHTVLKLVALSEGLMPYAEKQAYIIRRDANGTDQEFPVELEKIMKREAPDVTLSVGDILYIPDNKKRRTTMGIIDRITSFGASTASGVLVWRR
ncbi:MAG: polysaccharide biosynthesis/export family protein [Bryobacteraceae bacterium]